MHFCMTITQEAPEMWIRHDANCGPAILAIVLAMAGAAPVHAATLTRIPMVNATGACDGALPSYEGALRKRPVAIANEGSSTAFISCSLEGDNNSGDGTSYAAISFTNRGSQDATVNCTMITDTVDNRGYYPKSMVAVAFPQGASAMLFTAEADNSGQNFSNMINFSCALPPGVEVNYLYRAATEDVGL